MGLLTGTSVASCNMQSFPVVALLKTLPIVMTWQTHEMVPVLQFACTVSDFRE